MTKTASNLQIDSSRLWDTIHTTAQFGGTPKGGVRRLTLSAEDKQVRDWFRAACEKAGLEVGVDTLGNMFALRKGRDMTKPPIGLGSHPLGPILAPYGGMPATPGMFAVSWLDLRRMPVSAPAGSTAHWVSASLRVDGVMVWFVLDDTGLHLRCRHPDTPEARASLAAWLSEVADALVARAA